ncbi:MAG: PH domain-containing protein [Phormidesmis sp. RL_2_1]|nr:PH domain-containing protein [Phormidesmis sp. RL_2_1]
MFFRSAVDPWFYGLVTALQLVLLRAIIPALMGTNSTVVVLTIAAIAAIVIIPTWLLVATYYRVDSAILRIQAGPFFWSVPLDQIRSVTPTRSWLGSPLFSAALSVNRLKIDYGRERFVFVSPKNRAAFMEAIGHQPVNIGHRKVPNPFSLGEH